MSPNNALAFLLVALMATKTLAQTGYIDCFPGTLNIILAAPHGGELTPASIPDRTAGCWDVDTESCIWSHTCGTPDSNRYPHLHLLKKPQNMGANMFIYSR